MLFYTFKYEIKMKHKLLLVLLLATVTSFSQKKKIKLVKYTLTNIYNEKRTYYGKENSIFYMEKGFRVYNANGKKTKHKVTPDINFKYLEYVDNETKDTILMKSLKPKKYLILYPYTNAFMQVYIENSDKDIANGKVDLYVHRFVGASPGMMGANGMMMGGGSTFNENIYFKDSTGLHLISKKRHFKKYPMLLGEKKWKEMKKSKKGALQYLLDYFKAYNKAIEEKKNN